MTPMFSDNKFVLDSNVLITAKNGYYAFDISPSFWKHLIGHIRSNQIVIINRVRDEILARNDDLSDWMRRYVGSSYVSSNEVVIANIFSQMTNWVQGNNQFTLAAKNEFANVADGWLAAYAHNHGGTVVTLETYNENTKKRVKLPNVCRQFNVDYTDTFGMLRSLDIRF